MDSNQIIDALGGTSEVARICEVTTGAVSQWRDDGIPNARLMYLRLLRPEVFTKSGKPKPKRQVGSGNTAKAINP